MLNVLWIAFQPLPLIVDKLKLREKSVTGGWLQGAADIICRHDDIHLTYCFQYSSYIEGNVNGVTYYSMADVPDVRKKDYMNYRSEDLKRFQYILEQCKPDVIQVYGTEKWFNRQFVLMLNDLGLLNKTIVWIQGLTFFISMCHSNGLNIRQIRKKTFWEALRGTNIEGIQKRLALNGRGEQRVLGLLNNVFVRTEWDSACCRAMNPHLHLYYCNETLRPSFYENKIWTLDKVNRHSIFMSQYTTPIKGYHQMLKALKIILQEFPDTILYTTGRNLLHKPSTLLERLREPSYIRILREQIRENGLEQHVKFTGVLQENDMRDQYLMSHVFVSASTIENSPNSVGEAMILGVPIVASDVGGVSSLVTHREEGLLYPFDEYAVLAEYICKIFRNDELACELSFNARSRALKTHDQEENYKKLLQSYRKLVDKEKMCE